MNDIVIRVSDEEADMLLEALRTLRTAKEEARSTLNANKVGGRIWEPRDFGLPQLVTLQDRISDAQDKAYDAGRSI